MWSPLLLMAVAAWSSVHSARDNVRCPKGGHCADDPCSPDNLMKLLMRTCQHFSRTGILGGPCLSELHYDQCFKDAFKRKRCKSRDYQNTYVQSLRQLARETNRPFFICNAGQDIAQPAAPSIFFGAPTSLTWNPNLPYVPFCNNGQELQNVQEDTRATYQQIPSLLPFPLPSVLIVNVRLPSFTLPAALESEPQQQRKQPGKKKTKTTTASPKRTSISTGGYEIQKGTVPPHQARPGSLAWLRHSQKLRGKSKIGPSTASYQIETLTTPAALKGKQRYKNVFTEFKGTPGSSATYTSKRRFKGSRNQFGNAAKGEVTISQESETITPEPSPGLREFENVEGGDGMGMDAAPSHFTFSPSHGTSDASGVSQPGGQHGSYLQGRQHQAIGNIRTKGSQEFPVPSTETESFGETFTAPAVLSNLNDKNLLSSKSLDSEAVAVATEIPGYAVQTGSSDSSSAQEAMTLQGVQSSEGPHVNQLVEEANDASNSEEVLDLLSQQAIVPQVNNHVGVGPSNKLVGGDLNIPGITTGEEKFFQQSASFPAQQVQQSFDSKTPVRFGVEQSYQEPSMHELGGGGIFKVSSSAANRKYAQVQQN